MSSLTIKNGFKSPLEYISKLVGDSLDKFLTRKLDEVRVNLNEIQEIEAEHLEELNNYKDFNVEDLDKFENELVAYGEIKKLFLTISQFITESKSNIDNEDQFYNDFVLLHNDIQKLSETINKVTDKMNTIHDHILIKSSESMSSDVLKDLWSDEEELWDDRSKNIKITMAPEGIGESYINNFIKKIENVEVCPKCKSRAIGFNSETFECFSCDNKWVE